MAEPQQKSWLDLLKSSAVSVVAFLGAVASGLAPDLLNQFFPNAGIYIARVLFWGFMIILVTTLARSLWKVFRPDNPADLSLKQ